MKHNKGITIGIIILMVIVATFSLFGCNQEDFNDLDVNGLQELELLGNKTDFEVFLELFSDNGFQFVIEEQSSERSFLTAPQRALIIGDEIITIYEFETHEAMLKNSAYIDKTGFSISRPDGDEILEVQISWTSTPHFFSDGTLIVNYVGENEQILELLREHFGVEFAGGRYIETPEHPESQIIDEPAPSGDLIGSLIGNWDFIFFTEGDDETQNSPFYDNLIPLLTIDSYGSFNLVRYGSLQGDFSYAGENLFKAINLVANSEGETWERDDEPFFTYFPESGLLKYSEYNEFGEYWLHLYFKKA